MNDKEQIIKVEGLPLGAEFNWSVGVLMEKFIKSLGEKKLLGSKCPACGYVLAPPRTRCVKCNAKITESDLVELSGRGVLLGRTLANVELDGKCNFVDREKPVVIGAVKLDDADSTLFMPIRETELERLEIGAALAIEWADETKGETSDIKCFKPV